MQKQPHGTVYADLSDAGQRVTGDSLKHLDTSAQSAAEVEAAQRKLDAFLTGTEHSVTIQSATQESAQITAEIREEIGRTSLRGATPQIFAPNGPGERQK